MYNFTYMNVTEKKASDIKKVILLIQEVMALPDFIELKTNNFEKYESDMKEMFQTFSEKFPALFDKVIKEESISMINIILNGHVKVSRGQLTMDQAEEEIGKGIMNGIAYDNGFA